MSYVKLCYFCHKKSNSEFLSVSFNLISWKCMYIVQLYSTWKLAAMSTFLKYSPVHTGVIFLKTHQKILVSFPKCLLGNNFVCCLLDPQKESVNNFLTSICQSKKYKKKSCKINLYFKFCKLNANISLRLLEKNYAKNDTNAFQLN